MRTNSFSLGRTPALVMLLPLVALLFFAVFWPVVNLFGRSFFAPEFTLEYYETILSDALYWRVFLRTFWISALCCLLCLLIGFPIAYAMARTTAWRAMLIAACVLGPLWTSILVRSYAWIFLLQRNGVVNDLLIDLGLIDTRLRMLYTEGAVLIAMTHVLLPFMILPIFSTIRAIPTDLERSARNLGASRARAFLTVTLPLSLPGVSAGVLFVFILAIGFYITPALVGGPRTMMIGTLIAQQVTELLNWPLAGAISLLLLIISVTAALVFQRALSVGRIVGND